MGAGDSTLVDTFGHVDTALEKIENRHALRPLLDQLPARERRILVLRFFGELTQTQIGEQVGLYSGRAEQGRSQHCNCSHFYAVRSCRGAGGGVSAARPGRSCRSWE